MQGRFLLLPAAGRFGRSGFIASTSAYILGSFNFPVEPWDAERPYDHEKNYSYTNYHFNKHTAESPLQFFVRWRLSLVFLNA
jgi:hypothetical protein